ncbi:Sialidase [Podospora australis]|uniref:Sialidase n=1 Tax=Podospora australis TaxID=1536484 RepID=A0AAN6WVF6_9PEZI|nr:Sialidase [Podospora australis]
MAVRLATAVYLALQASVAVCSSSLQTDPVPFSPFSRRIIYDPPAGSRASYPRQAELQDGTLLVTTTVMGDSFFRANASFPVFESKDGGVTWDWISNITDQVNGWGMSAQPAIYELPEPLGGFEAGTILASGNSWSDNGTRIDLYASTDKARTWQFVSRVAEGGRPNTTNGATPIWEPFLLAYNHELIVYYSDQRDPEHGQKLAHQRSADLRTWGPVVNDVAYELYIARPGMTVVAHIPPINKWILVYEYPIGNSSSHGVNYPVYYRLAEHPTEFDSAPGIPIVIEGKVAPNASPYVVWSPSGGPNGTIIVSDADRDEVYSNRFGGDPEKWEMHPCSQPSAYSRALHVFNKYPENLMVLGGSTFDSGGPEELSLSVFNLTELVAAKLTGADLDKYAAKPESE